MTHDVKIYTSATCPYCVAAKQLLKDLGASFKEIALDTDPELRQGLMDEYAWRTVPLVLINGELIGGFDDLMKLHQTGNLQPLLAGPQ